MRRECGVRRLTVLYDATCGFCVRCRRWLEAQPKLVRLDFVPAYSMEEASRFPGLPRAHDLMFGRGLMGLKSLHSKAGLPQSCYGLLMAACDVVKDAKEEGLPLDPEGFGRRLIEALMTRYENMQTTERSKNLEFIGRFAEDRVQKIAKRLRADMVRAA